MHLDRLNVGPQALGAGPLRAALVLLQFQENGVDDLLAGDEAVKVIAHEGLELPCALRELGLHGLHAVLHRLEGGVLVEDREILHGVEPEGEGGCGVEGTPRGDAFSFSSVWWSDLKKTLSS